MLCLFTLNGNLKRSSAGWFWCVCVVEANEDTKIRNFIETPPSPYSPVHKIT